MTTNEKLTTYLNDLIQINNDRISGYEKAITVVENIDVDLKTIFNKLACDSRLYKSELEKEVKKLGGQVAEGRTAAGTIYQAWMGVKATFTNTNRQTTLESCKFGEDAAQTAYSDVLDATVNMSEQTRQLLNNQKDDLKSSLEAIKKLRDTQRSVNH